MRCSRCCTAICKGDGPTPLWNAIDRAIDKVLLEKSRRIVLALSDGVDEPLDFSGHAKSMKDEMKRAEDNDIMIYAVGMAAEKPMGGRRLSSAGYTESTRETTRGADRR